MKKQCAIVLRMNNNNFYEQKELHEDGSLYKT